MEGRITVGRTPQIETILNGQPGEGGLFEIQGGKGAGKSEFLNMLRTRIPDGDVVEKIDMETIRRGLALGLNESVDLERDFRLFCDGIDRIVDLLKSDAEPIKRAVDQLARFRPARPMMKKSMNAGFSNAVLRDSTVPKDIGERVRQVIGIMRDAATRFARDYADGGRVYLLIDSFETVPGEQLRAWFVDLFSSLEGIVVVVADQATKRNQRLFPEARYFWLNGLTRQEVEQFLRAAGIDPERRDIVEPVMTFTEGHAQAVSLAVNMINDTGSEGSVRLLRRLAALDQPPAKMIAPLVREIVESQENADIREALELTLVLRRFDAEVVAGILGPSVGDPERLVQRLAQYSFVESHGDPFDDERYYTAHRYVREVAGQVLVTEPGSHYRELQRKAYDYYAGKVVSDLPDDYDDWFRYEQDTWQVTLGEWLYHVSRLGTEHRSEARMTVARIFFDTFWWWGNYVAFPFCEQILDEWTELAEMFGVSDDAAWGRQLRKVYQLYPKGWRRERTPQEWQDLHRTLRYLLRQGGLTGPTPEDPNARHVRGLVAIYLAEAKRFLDPADEQVDAVLQDAYEQFRADDDDWNLAWLPFQEAEAALGRGDHRRAIDLVEAVADQVDEMDDRELRANLHRVYADARWLSPEHDVRRAMDGYTWAVLLAYQFHGKSAADLYTLEFMNEMLDRAKLRLTELSSTDPVLLVEVCTRIREFFDLYWRITFAPPPPDYADLFAHNRADEALTHLFPAPPALADVEDAHLDSEYMLTAGDYFDRLTIPLNPRPGAPLPLT
ncbi:MAG TPA: hypothetical protein VHV74_24365 [Pseudonocardiaceae bacterium]|nr:hypothetical protein [Pseudonocardiaceae bacterium]